LTDLGFGPQCQELSNFLQNSLELAQKVDLIVISPMRRTLQTATQGLGFLIERGVPVVLRAEFQENSDKPCDTGSEIEIMSKEWPMYDWSSVDAVYPAKTGLYAFDKDALINRGVVAKTWLRNRPEKVIAVVSHAGFLRLGLSQRKYENADFRIFEFGDEEVPTLIEWPETENRGGGMGKSMKGVFGVQEWDSPKNQKEHNPAELPK
jgi:broad specificity phosphatase PhoE